MAEIPLWQQLGYETQAEYDEHQRVANARAAGEEVSGGSIAGPRVIDASKVTTAGDSGGWLKNGLSGLAHATGISKIPGYSAATNVVDPLIDTVDYLHGGSGGGGVISRNLDKVPVISQVHDVRGGIQHGVNYVLGSGLTQDARSAAGAAWDAYKGATTPQLPGGGGVGGGLDPGLKAAAGTTQSLILDKLTAAGNARSAPQLPSTAQVRPQIIAPTSKVGGTTIQGANIGAVTPMQASQAGYQTLAPTQQAQASQVGPMNQAAGVGIDQRPQGEVRAQQMRTLQALQGRSDGTAPSVVDMELRRAAERNNANQYSFAASARGPQQAGALRQAMLNVGRQNAGLAADAAQARIKEMDAATNTLANAQTGVRGADVGLATNQAQLDSGNNQFNVGQTNTGRLKQADLSTATSQFNAGQGNAMSQAQGQLNNATALTNAQLGTQAASKNLDVRSSQAITQAQLDQGRYTNQAQLDSGARQFNASAENTRAGAQAALSAAAEQYNAGASNQAAQVNLEAKLKQAGLDDNQISTYLNALLTGQGQLLGQQQHADDRAWQAEQIRAANNRNLLGGAFNEAGKLGELALA